MSRTAHPETALPSTGLSRELTDFLVEFATSLQKRAMYPDGHPMLLATVDRLQARFGQVLGERPALAIGVARRQLLIDGSATPPESALCRELAGRLHRHRVASLRLLRGVTAEELGDLLARVAVEPSRGQRPLGATTLPEWPQIVIQPTGYDRIALRDQSGGEESGRGGGDDLWLELARLSLDGDVGEATGDGVLDRVAAGISRRIETNGHGPAVLAQLTRLAESLGDAPEGTGRELRERVSALFSRLDPGALARLIADGTVDERERFTEAAVTGLAAETAVQVVEAAAAAGRHDVSPHLLRLLRKLGHLARTGPDLTRTDADAAVRHQVASLLTDWRLDDPNPTQYTGVLEAMTRGGGAADPEALAAWDPLAMLRTGLEIGDPGARAQAAASALVQAGRLADVLAALMEAPSSETAEPIWRLVATPDALRRALADQGTDSSLVTALIARLGADAVDPLIDLLAASEDHASRTAALGALTRLGAPAAARAAALLPESPWFLQRNLLVLLGRTGAWPEGFSPARYAEHADPRVRREAVKLLLESADGREDGLVRGLADPDPAIAAVALAAAVERCPLTLLPWIERMARDPGRLSAHRVLAIRVLARSGSPLALEALTGIALTRRRWLRRRRLAPRSPELLAAVAGLAAHWAADAAADQVLTQADGHSDPEIRAAARRSP